MGAFNLSFASLPGLTPQVGFTRLAVFETAQLGQARVALQSIIFALSNLGEERWMRGSSPRMTDNDQVPEPADER
jgi:hypothetical protein